MLRDFLLYVSSLLNAFPLGLGEQTWDARLLERRRTVMDVVIDTFGTRSIFSSAP